MRNGQPSQISSQLLQSCSRAALLASFICASASLVSSTWLILDETNPNFAIFICMYFCAQHTKTFGQSFYDFICQLAFGGWQCWEWEWEWKWQRQRQRLWLKAEQHRCNKSPSHATARFLGLRSLTVFQLLWVLLSLHLFICCVTFGEHCTTGRQHTIGTSLTFLI